MASNEDNLQKELNNAQEAENSKDFFSAAHHYKEALSIARSLGDSESITLCKNKIVEMNQKSKDAFKELNVETTVPNEEIDKVVNSILDGALETILKKIGVHPFLFPKMQQVEESARKSMPISYQIATLSTISQDGHLVKGGGDGNYSWIIQTYGMQQDFITEFYLRRVFEGLANKGFNEESLVAYLRGRGTFPENNLAIIATGINRYFAHDYVSALHILIPQFENVFLFISERLGIDIIALNRGKDISTQLKTLSVEHLNSEAFQNKWHRDFCEQIKFVLFEPLGYVLRHKIAHGQITVAECTPQMTNLVLFFFLVLAARIGVNPRPQKSDGK